MNGLRELLDGVAAEAKVYDVTERAVRAARTRRYTPVAALLVVVLVVVGVWIPLASSPPGEAPAARPVRWLPEVVAVPEKIPPTLTPQRRVGRGSLLVQILDWPGMLLIAENGWQYTVPDGRSISPDGRWLLLAEKGRLLVQDLIAGGRRQLGETDPDIISMYWSANGRWLVLAPCLPEALEPDGYRTLTLIDTTSWRSVLVRALPPSTYALGVFDSGEIVTQHVEAEGDAPGQLGILHPSGAERVLSLAAVGALTKGAQVHDIMPDGANLLIRSWPASGIPDDVLVLDSVTGAVRRRVALADPVPAPGGGTGIREFVAMAPEGILMWTSARVVELELMDPDTGRLTVVARRTDDRIQLLYPRGYGQS